MNSLTYIKIAITREPRSHRHATRVYLVTVLTEGKRTSHVIIHPVVVALWPAECQHYAIQDNSQAPASRLYACCKRVSDLRLVLPWNRVLFHNLTSKQCVIINNNELNSSIGSSTIIINNFTYKHTHTPISSRTLYRRSRRRKGSGGSRRTTGPSA